MMGIFKQKLRSTPIGLLAMLLIALAATTTVQAQIDLQARIGFRPLTPEEITAYKLPSTTETSGGLMSVGVGQPAYLEAQINIAVPAADILGVTWTLTTKPKNSKAALADSPLGMNVPLFEPSDRQVAQPAGRTLLRPDVEGVYVVTGYIATKSNGTATLGQTVLANNYVGIAACSLCHSGGLADVKTPAWSKTLHSHIFKDGITGVNGTSYGSGCYSCHTVGYDLNSTVPNGGFDKVAAQLGWTPPATLAPANWDALPAALKNVANIQCENCHGPGSLHAQSGGTPWEMSIGTTTGVCAQCHGAATHHVKQAEWSVSMHAVTTRDPSGAGRESCVGCHTGAGFIGRVKAAKTVDTTYGAINCQTCHEPHGQTVPDGAAHQVRTLASLKLADGTNITKGGTGMLCMNCHQSRQNAANYVATTPGSSHFGPHEGPQADMLEGTNGFTYGQKIPTSAHAFVAADTCVTCHMQTVAATDKGFLQAGGHTFKPSWTDATTKTTQDLVAACQNCHGPEVTSFDFPLFDYNDDGKIDGVQTEVQSLLDQLSAMLPPVGKPKTALTIDATWTQPQLKAAYNWLFVNNDGSKGVHNTAYAVGLLKASIADMKANAK